MRTTLTLDPDVAALLDEQLHRERKPFKQVVNDVIRRALSPRPVTAGKPFRVTPVRARLRPQIDPNVNFRHLADQLEDEEIVRKMRRGTR